MMPFEIVYLHVAASKNMSFIRYKKCLFWFLEHSFGVSFSDLQNLQDLGFFFVNGV